jgi:hypothetical protein
VHEALEIYAFKPEIQHTIENKHKSDTYDSVLGVVSVKVDTADEHRGIGRRSRDDDLLGAALEMCLCPIMR